MNQFTDISSADIGSTAWRRHLAALPAVDPPEALWERLQQARHASPALRSRSPWTRTAAAAGMAVAAAALFAAVLIWPRNEPTALSPGNAPSLARQSSAPANARSDAGLRRLDDEISLAYAHDADEAQIAALWQTRARLIESLQGPTPALLARM